MLQAIKSLLALTLLTSCTTLPSGPAVLVLPGADKDFGQFQSDDVYCRQLARNQITSSQPQPNSTEEGQQQYDMSFMQCMYSKGHRIPLLDPVLYDSIQEGDEPAVTEPPRK